MNVKVEYLRRQRQVGQTGPKRVNEDKDVSHICTSYIMKPHACAYNQHTILNLFILKCISHFYLTSH